MTGKGLFASFYDKRRPVEEILDLINLADHRANG